MSGPARSPSLVAAGAVAEELAGGGVTDVVLCPGSRSAPLAYALEAAERGGLLRLHVRIDERSAGFTALGLARGSGRPVAVVTTSGTAVANLHPAVLEASHAGVALLVISADRPATMVDTGANQTTRQVGIFGTAVRADARLGVDSGPALRAALRRLLVAATGVRTAHPGPVHLNLELLEPLTPEAPLPPLTTAAPGLVVSRPEHREVELAEVAETVVLVGDTDPAQGAGARALAEAARLPLLSEPSGNARAGECAIATYRLLLEGPLGRRIRRVLVVGHPTLSRPVTRLLGRVDVELVVVGAAERWSDPGHRVSQVLGAVRVPPSPPSWLAQWREADADVSGRLAALLTDHSGPSGPGLAAVVAASLRADDLWLLGSSASVRDADLAPVWAGQGPQVHANRGLAGIDGTLATGLGLALGSGRPVTALVGDLTFLHDVNGLLLGPGEPRAPLRIVVANDGGGAIFATLEQGRPELSAPFERLFATPHTVDLAALAAAYGLIHRPVGSPEQLTDLLERRVRGIELVEVRLDRSARRGLDEAIRALTA